MKKHQLGDPCVQQIRFRKYRYPKWTKEYYNRETGEETAFQPVVDRFYRLNNGLWIHTVPGKEKGSKYKWSEEEKVRRQQHVVAGRELSEMLDKFVTDEHRRPHYFPDLRRVG